MSLLRAFRNLFLAVRADPAWALTAATLGPPALLRHLLRTAALVVVAGLALSLAARLLLSLAGVASKASPLYSAAMALVWVAVAVIGGRALVLPLLRRWGGAGAQSDTHGSARFATAAESAPLVRAASGLLIGRDGATGRLLRYSGPSHLLTIAPTRTGKGVGTIIPNLIDHPGALVCIDPKGENARVAARERRRFGPVHVLDPFGVTGLPSASYNPLLAIDPHGLDLADDCMTLADALVHDAPGEGGEAHWNEEAKALIAGILLHVVTTELPERCTLDALRHRLTLPPRDFTAQLTAMQSQGGLVARAANRMLGKSDREAAGVLSSAQRHTHFLDSPRMGRVLERSDFRFGDLKAEPATVFLVLPPDRLATYARWLRLMVAQSLTELARAPATPPIGANDRIPHTAAPALPVLFLLDEFAALGRLDPVERAMGLMAGYGVQLWPILQDVHQLRGLYGKGAGTFLSNAGVLQVFGVNDHDSARLVSDLLGQETVVFETMSRAIDAEGSVLTFGAHHTGRPLLTPDEVRTLPADRQLLFLAGQRPIVAGKLRYFADREFAGRFDKAA